MIWCREGPYVPYSVCPPCSDRPPSAWVIVTEVCLAFTLGKSMMTDPSSSAPSPRAACAAAPGEPRVVPRRLIEFCNEEDTAERWIKEAKHAPKWTQLSF
jgi:hypothetical protein